MIQVFSHENNHLLYSWMNQFLNEWFSLIKMVICCHQLMYQCNLPKEYLQPPLECENMELKSYSSPKWKVHLPSCRSKPVKAYCPIDCQVNDSFEAQKSMKSIVRRVHLPSVVQSEFNEATRTLLKMTLFNNSSPMRQRSAILESIRLKMYLCSAADKYYIINI